MNRPASCASTLDRSYDVFLNCWGKDTGYRFTGNLYNALTRAGLHTFMGNVEGPNGDEITQAHLEAIEESTIAIVVFSPNYASSPFCLNELVQILRRVKGNGRLIWPIFYDVKPSDVRKQGGKYEEAFSVHGKNFKLHEIQDWKFALHQAADLGDSSYNSRNEYEYKFIKKTVEYISKVKCQLVASNEREWDPMECELQSHQKRGPWPRLVCSDFFTFVASMCSS